MKRFVDVRDADIGGRFSFWDTSVDRYEEYSGEQAWDTFSDFESAFLEDTKDYPHRSPQIARYRNLCPPWTFLEPADNG